MGTIPEGFCTLLPREFFLIANWGEESSESDQFLWNGNCRSMHELSNFLKPFPTLFCSNVCLRGL